MLTLCHRLIIETLGSRMTLKNHGVLTGVNVTRALPYFRMKMFWFSRMRIREQGCLRRSLY